MFVTVWEYEVRPGSERAFEGLQGADGAWVELFRAHAGYLGSEVLRDESTRRYLTIDRWASAADYDRFLEAGQVRYAQIDSLGDALTVTERRLGRFETP
ncbi:antibiotic biosynthesis monooxygenase [Lysobacter koreensis]|uniref:Antibiotic biosynthesis monooxygenase n=1 Tax=Lysobacter koreensis TaxID=266122 RepID=A0ABW2YRQ9_9GAMM